MEKTYTPHKWEESVYKQWEDSGFFKPHQKASQKPFVVMMPPPNVTGRLHMGHALNYTLQDVLIRYHRMQGRETLWLPGTDHAGIATQSVVERQLESQGTNRKTLGREAFLERMWQWKESSGHTIVHQQKRLGASPDWHRSRFTLDEGLNHAVRTVFVQLYKDGLIYRDHRLVNWDPKLLTAVSDLEVQGRPCAGSFWFIRYPLVEDPSQGITVATTRPETLFGDVAVAVHPEDTRYKAFHGKTLRLPLTQREIPVVTDLHSDPEKGTGAVKITPAHDFDDFEVGKRHDLPLWTILDAHGNLEGEKVPPAFQGLDRFKARQEVVKALENQGYLVKTEEKEILVPYGERSGVVLEPRLTEQWFMHMDPLAEKALKAVEDGRTRFVPDHWKATYFQWLKNIQPWCISRQLWWGHQIPAWYCPQGQIFVALTESEARTQAQALYGKEVPLTQDPDVLDTWFSSALWPFSTLGWPEETADLKAYYPGDVLVTGFDIIFFWVARMMMMGLYFMKDVPFRTVYINALVRDEKGQKMSKSKGNVVDPLDLMDTYGTDALRLTMAALAVPGVDLKFSKNQVEGYRNFCTKVWNAARFCVHHGCVWPVDFKPETVTSWINQWILQRLKTTAEELSEHLNQNRFDLAAQTLYHFVWDEFCDWSIELSKGLLESPQEAQETRNTLAWVLGTLLHLMHPFAPFLTEVLWNQALGRKELLIGRSWPCLAPWPQSFEDASQGVQWCIALIRALRVLRIEKRIPLRTSLRLILVTPSEKIQHWLPSLQNALKVLGRVDSVTYAFEGADHFNTVQGQQEQGTQTLSLVHEGATFLIPLEGVMDVQEERQRLKKKLEETEKTLKPLLAKLRNQDFMQKAPPEVLEKTKERLLDVEKTKKNLEEALKNIAEAI